MIAMAPRLKSAGQRFIALTGRIHALPYLRAAARLQEGDPYIALDVALPPEGDSANALSIRGNGVDF